MPKKPAPPQDTPYTYTGDGVGLPNLPHVVTREQAAERGLLDQLEAAIERGDYQSQEPPVESAPETNPQEA
jgi:hypothetical protein